MTVTLDQRYEQVWAKPMLAFAKEYEVVANHLAWACASLDVHRPANLQAGLALDIGTREGVTLE